MSRHASAVLIAATVLAAQAASATDPRQACLTAPPSEALTLCEAGLIDQPGDLAIKRVLAEAYLTQHQEVRALRLLEEIAETYPQDWQAQFDFAAAMIGLQMVEQARPYARRALALAPEDVATLRLNAAIHELTGNLEGAFDMHLRLALAGVPTAMYALAEDFARARGTPADQKRARDWYTRAADAGHVRAMLVLAAKLRHGAFGTAPEPGLAETWARRAARLSAGLPGSGHAPAPPAARPPSD